MLPSLYDEERRALLRLATMLILGGSAVLPLATQSSSIAGAAVSATLSTGIGVRLPPRLTFPGFSLTRDPFVPSAVTREKLEGAAMRIDQSENIGVVLPPNAGAGAPVGPPPDAPAMVPLVRAVVLGTPARALVEDEGKVRVFAVGDRIGELRIAKISATGITLSDGTRLPLAAKRQ